MEILAHFVVRFCECFAHDKLLQRGKFNLTPVGSFKIQRKDPLLRLIDLK